MAGAVHTRTASDSVALTFDDGPTPWTAVLLDVLARLQARATFFVTPGPLAASLVRRMVAEGHEVGYHCGTHVRHGARDADHVREEAAADLAWLAELGVVPGAWRPPWGDLAPWSTAVAAELGMDLWLWSEDTRDWDGRGTPAMLAGLAGSLGGGSIVLMHDGIGPGALRATPLTTLDLMAPLVGLCRERALEPGALVAVEEPVGA